MATIAERAERGGGESIAGSSPSSGRQEGHGRNQVEKQSGKGSAYGVRQRRRGAAWLQAVNAYISAKISEPSFHGVTIYPVVVKSEKAGYLLDWNPQPKRSRPQVAIGNQSDGVWVDSEF